MFQIKKLTILMLPLCLNKYFLSYGIKIKKVISEKSEPK